MAKKRMIPENTGIYFELINTKSTRFILPDNSLVDFSLGMPFNCLDIYKSGVFPYLGLKEGAEVLFKDDSEESLVKLIAAAPRQEDADILNLILLNRK